MGIYFPDGKGGKHFVGTESSYSLQAASSTEKGGVIITGDDGLVMDGETLKADIKEIPTASKTVKGGVMVGENLYMQGDSLNASIPIASATKLGGIKAGLGMRMNGDSLESAIITDMTGAPDFIEGIYRVQLNQAGFDDPRTTGIAGELDMNGYHASVSGGIIIMGSSRNGNGGTIRAHGGGGGNGGFLDLSAQTNIYGSTRGNGGIIDMSGAQGGTIKGDIYFEGTPTFQNGANGLDIATVSGATIPTATTSQSGLMSASDKTKLNDIASGAQANVIESVKVNGTALAVSNKSVNIDLSGKVDKVSGKDLSTNDYTKADKAKLDSLASITTAGENITISGGTIKAADTKYTLPTASTTTKGGIKVGTGLAMNGDTLNCTVVAGTTYTLPTASTSTKGGVKVGKGLTMDGETLKPALGVGLSVSSADNIYLKRASDTEKGGVIVTGNDGLVMDGETLKANIPNATTVKAGLMSASDKTKLDSFKAASQYVTVVSGKGLSTNDYTTAEKNKLAAISVSGGNVVIDTSNLVTKESGKGLSTNDYTNADKSKLNSLASITAAGENITISGGTIKAANTTYSDATTTKSGLMSASDKAKLDSVDTSKYVTIVSGKGLSTNDYTTAEKQKLATLTGGTTYTLPTASTSTKGGVKVGSGLTMDGETLKSTFTGYSNSDTIRISGSALVSSSDTVTANNGGSILALGGAATGSDTSTATGGNGGTINMNGGNAEGNSSSKAGHGGYIHLNGGDGQIPGTGGVINLQGGISKTSTIKNGAGGTINLYGGADTNAPLGGDGGTIDMRGGVGNMSSGRGGDGGVIDLRGGVGATIGSAGSIRGDIFFTGTPTFLNGANGLSNTVSSSNVYIPTAAFDSIMANFTG